MLLYNYSDPPVTGFPAHVADDHSGCDLQRVHSLGRPLSPRLPAYSCFQHRRLRKADAPLRSALCVLRSTLS